MSFDFVLPHTIHISEPMTPYIEPLSNEAQFNGGTNDYLHRIGSTLLQSMQLGYAVPPSAPLLPVATVNAGFVDSKASPPAANNLSAMDELQKQLQYDKFMNEVWIGIVLTLVIISLLFCICSCLLYHQFRKWKRNYHNTASQSVSSNTDTDIESSTKSKSSAFNDPVPEYALVSGLPSYEAALELLQIEHIKLTTTTTTTTNNNQLQQQQQQINDEQNEIIPLLPTTTTTITILNEKDLQQQSTTTTTNEKVKTLEKLQDNNDTIKNNSHKKC